MTASACNHSDDDHIEKGEQDPAQPVLSEKGRFDLSKGTNGNPPIIKLSSGYDMPIVGLGTYSLHGDKCVNAILSAIRLGYLIFPCLRMPTRQSGSPTISAPDTGSASGLTAICLMT